MLHACTQTQLFGIVSHFGFGVKLFFFKHLININSWKEVSVDILSVSFSRERKHHWHMNSFFIVSHFGFGIKLLFFSYTQQINTNPSKAVSKDIHSVSFSSMRKHSWHENSLNFFCSNLQVINVFILAISIKVGSRFSPLLENSHSSLN